MVGCINSSFLLLFQQLVLMKEPQHLDSAEESLKILPPWISHGDLEPRPIPWWRSNSLMKVFMILIVHADFSADPRCKLEVEVHISIVWQNICTSLNRERFHDDPCSLLSQLPEDNYKVRKVWHTGTCSLCASTPVAKILVHVLKVAGALLGPRSHDLICTPEKHANKVQRVWKQIPKFMNVFCCGLSMLFNSLVFQDPSVMTLKPVIRGQLQSMKGTAYWHMLIVCINSCRKNSCACCEGSGRTCPHHSWVHAVTISSAHQKSMQTRSKGCGTRYPSSWTCFVVDSACYSTAWPSKTLQWWHWSQLSEDNQSEPVFFRTVLSLIL